MDEAGIKSARRLLRVVSDHLRLTCRDRGAQIEALDLVDVIYHPRNPTPTLNVVTPRRSTAWVAAGYIQPGLSRLRELGRPPRVQYIAGLYPPQFAVVLRDLGLTIEHETPLMIWELPDAPDPVVPLAPEDTPTEAALDTPPMVDLPKGGRIERVDDADAQSPSRRLWDHVWRGAYYDVMMLGLEETADADPKAPPDDLPPPETAAELSLRTIHDFIYWHHQQPIGAARLIVRPDLGSAHLEALALDDSALRDTGTTITLSMNGDHDPEATRAPDDSPPPDALILANTVTDDDETRLDILGALIQAALIDARAAACKVVFVPADNDDERRACRRLGFVDLSSIVRYAAPNRWEGERYVAKAVFSQQK
ncbi:MAG: hypothetical protein SGI73_04550 [Chloroflexota bacterium]|nr:hypothetical protein [Chloroflexota bacterium]